MANPNIRRVPFVLNLEDPVDAAIWEILEPLLARRRASQFIRGVVAQALGIGVAMSAPPTLPIPARLPALPSGATSRSVHRRAKVQEGEAVNEDEVSEAANNFLNAFG